MVRLMTALRARRVASSVSLSLVALFAAPLAAQAQGEVNVYSYREPGLIAPLLKAFTDKTGIKVNVVTAPGSSSGGLAEKMQAEGQNSPADLLFTVDIGRLTEAVELGVTQPVTSKALEDAVPASYRDKDNQWFGLTMRARVVYASKDRVKQDAITYEELADPKWKGKICIRSGKHDYNVSLIASMIAHKGEAATETWLKGVKENLARKPAGGDREQVRDVQAGLCDIAIGNTYYMAAMLANPQQKAWADAVRIIFPNAADRGSQVNVSGMALAKYAPNKANALKLMEFLASAEGQKIYAEANSEYPVNAAVAPSQLVQSWGKLKPDAQSLSEVAKYRKKAIDLVDKVGFDAGPST
jgi:iron(III) transport system substrate-binding protein